MKPYEQKAEEFLKVAHEFHLGELPTETRHPLTYELSTLAKNNLTEAYGVMKQIDLEAISKVVAQKQALAELARAVKSTFAEGGKVYLYGCGATGRLSLSLDYLWRFLQKGTDQENHVLGFMSGGDLALVRSIENFEDHPEYGARQVREIGFKDGDLLISCTEGGETPSVIGATEEATRISRRQPFYLYCNPDHVLHEQVERSRRVLENPKIKKICLFTGPMALSGSTRMQASTVLMLGVGSALLPATQRVPEPAYLYDALKALDTGFLKAFTELEAEIYKNGGHVLYKTNHYGMTIITDTTERSPTFSLTPFENSVDGDTVASLCFLCIPDAKDSRDSWRKILLRDPIPLDWAELKGVATERRLYGFDFSPKLMEFRGRLLKGPQEEFLVDRDGPYLTFKLKHLEHRIPVDTLHPLAEHLLLKMLLNAHSTLVMGRLSRYESNVMTWVKPSNGKLIDRAIRYVEYLLVHEKSHQFSYADIAREIFRHMEDLRPEESVVIKTFDSLRQKKS